MKWLEILLKLVKVILSGHMAKAAEKEEDLETPEEILENPENDISEFSADEEAKQNPPAEEPKDIIDTEDDREAFQKALKLVLKYEGGYVNDPDDPGGPTNKGVTQKVYDKYRRGQHKAVKSVRDIPQEEVEDIYFKNYWLKGKCNKLPDKIAVVHFDTCVNTGIKQASKFLQRSVEAGDDGIIGPKTIDAFNKKLKSEGESFIVKDYLSQRRSFYRLISDRKPALKKFLRGWMNRVSHLEKTISTDIRIV